jgi:FMN-dependent oxidoreductase (nitrilotriacetate monooxygenase family)
MEQGGQLALLDPLPILAIMSRASRHLGLGATLSTTYLPTYQLARALATLDLLSGGRAAWNVVTSASTIEAQNFGLDGVGPRDRRYDRADEVLEACCRLWDSWEQDALLIDRRSGRFADGAKIHAADYAGAWIRSKGPLTVPRSPQGRPVIMQAGASDRGRDFAGRWAEMIFTLQYDKPGMEAFYADVKGRMGDCGRDPASCAILTSIDVIVAETESIAREKQDFINALIRPEHGLALMSGHLGFDVSQFPLDQPLPDVRREEGSRGSFDIILRGAGEEKLTLGETARRFATSQLCPQIVGTAAQVADHLEYLFEGAACDGFIVNPTVFPGTFEQVVRMVAPELQRRGLFRTEYRGRTLRENLLDAA